MLLNIDAPHWSLMAVATLCWVLGGRLGGGVVVEIFALLEGGRFGVGGAVAAEVFALVEGALGDARFLAAFFGFLRAGSSEGSMTVWPKIPCCLLSKKPPDVQLSASIGMDPILCILELGAAIPSSTCASAGTVGGGDSGGCVVEIFARVEGGRFGGRGAVAAAAESVESCWEVYGKGGGR